MLPAATYAISDVDVLVAERVSSCGLLVMYYVGKRVFLTQICPHSRGENARTRNGWMRVGEWNGPLHPSCLNALQQQQR